MKFPVIAFLWQEWRLSRVAIVSVCAASVSFSLLCHRTGKGGEPAAIGACWLLVFLACVSALLRSGGRDSQTMPRFFLTLPIRSGFWASVHFAYGVGILMILGVCLFRFHVLLFGAESEFLPIPDLSAWKVALGAGALGGLLEGVFLLVGCIGSPMLAVTSLVVALTAFVAGSAFVGGWDWIRERNHRPAMWTVTRRPQPAVNSGMSFKGRPASPAGVPRGAPQASDTQVETQANTGTIAAAPTAGGGPGTDGQHTAARRAALMAVRAEEARKAAMQAAQQKPRDAQDAQARRYVLRRTAAQLDRTFEEPFLPLFWTATLFVGYLCSCAGVMFYRHGPASVLRLGIPLTALGVRSLQQDFASPEAAAVWFEWKRFGRFLPIVTCAFAAALWFVRGPFASQSVLLGFSLLCSLPALGLGVYMTLRRHWDHGSGIDTFLFALPVTTRALATARFRMAARGVGMAGAVFLFFIYQSAQEYPEPVWIAIAFATSLIYMWSLLWLALPVFYAGILLVISIRIVDGSFGLGTPEDLAPWQLLLAAVLAIPMLVVFWKAYKARMLLGAGMVCALAVSLATACVFAVYWPHSEVRSVPALLLLFAAALIPAVPFATVPLSIRWYRHR